jgi:hypothetical protein
MKCANPNCNRGIGLITYRRFWSSKRRYCSKQCCESPVAPAKRSQQEQRAMTYLEWLFSQPIENPRPKLIPIRVRPR